LDTALRCPKCGTPRPDAGEACRRCGLRLDRWVAFTADQPVPHPMLDDAWTALEEAWADRSAHERFLVVARSLSALDGAAARYRARLRARPDDEGAARALEELGTLALQHQAESPHEAPPGIRTAYVATFVVGLLMLAGVAAFLWKVAVLRNQ
jgi:hypothetical protein